MDHLPDDGQLRLRDMRDHVTTRGSTAIAEIGETGNVPRRRLLRWLTGGSRVSRFCAIAVTIGDHEARLGPPPGPGSGRPAGSLTQTPSE